MSKAPERIWAWTAGAGMPPVVRSVATAGWDKFIRADIAEAEAATLRAKLAEARADALREAAEIANAKSQARKIEADLMPWTHRRKELTYGRGREGEVIRDAILARIAEDDQ